MGVAHLANKYKFPLIGIAGHLGQDLIPLYRAGFTALFSINPRPQSLAHALNLGPKNLETLAYNLGRLLTKTTH